MGLFFGVLSCRPSEPRCERAVAFIDGQNLFHAAREAFGYSYPNYDPRKLADRVCADHNWHLEQVRFYTGVPAANDNPFWNHFWAAKLAQMGRQGVWTYSRSLRYQNQTFTLDDGRQVSFLKGHEKGIDVRIALDIVQLVLEGSCDVVLLFSQDQDLSEVAEELRVIARREQRWIKIASAFPVSPTSKNRRGVDKTDWISVDRKTYDRCLDPRDYRPKKES